MSVVLLDTPASPPIPEDRPPPAFEPYIAAATTMRELTVLPLVVGTLLGMIFGASSLYLVLKVGLTVSASIPVAVISITLFRLLSKIGRPGRDDSREQHRADRRIGGRVDRLRPRRDDAGDHDPRLRSGDHARHAGRGARRAARHPDDDPAAPGAHRAAARHPEIPGRHRLRRGAEGRRVGRVAGRRVGVGEARAGAARRRRDQRGDDLHRVRRRACLQGAERRVQGLEGRAAEDLRARRSRPARSSAEISPELLGVGYIIGPRIASIMCAGGVLAYLVLIPAIKFFGAGTGPAARARARCRSAT